MTALPLRAPFAELEARMRAQLEARMRAQSEAFDKSTAPRAKGPEFINFTGVSSPTAWGVYRRVPNRAVSGR